MATTSAANVTRMHHSAGGILTPLDETDTQLDRMSVTAEDTLAPKRRALPAIVLIVAAALAIPLGALAAEFGTFEEDGEPASLFAACFGAAVLGGCIASAFGSYASLATPKSEMSRAFRSTIAGFRLTMIVLAVFIIAYIGTFRLGWGDHDWEVFHYGRWGFGRHWQQGTIELFLLAVAAASIVGAPAGFLVWAVYPRQRTGLKWWWRTAIGVLALPIVLIIAAASIAMIVALEEASSSR